MKPDWATRLQRTFARKYDAGFAKGLMLGKAVGAQDAREITAPIAHELGVQDERARIIAIIEQDCDEAHSWLDKCNCYILTDLIRGEQ
jgi:hypothetical protein